MKKAKNYIVNKFDGMCDQCKSKVVAKTGRVLSVQGMGSGPMKWTLRHDSCFYNSPQPRKEKDDGE